MLVVLFALYTQIVLTSLQTAHFPCLISPTVPESNQTVRPFSASVSLVTPSGPGISKQSSLVIAFSTAQAAQLMTDDASYELFFFFCITMFFGLFVPDGD